MFLNIDIAMESPLHRQVFFKAYCHMGLAFITCQLIQNGFDRWAGMVSLPKLNTLYVWLVPEAPSLDQIFRRSGTSVDHALLFIIQRRNTNLCHFLLSAKVPCTQLNFLLFYFTNFTLTKKLLTLLIPISALALHVLR